MEYTVKRLAGLAGISARTLRFYDEIGLLKPARVSASGYRMYGRKEVDALQQILLYRELGMELSAIAGIMHSPGFDRLKALRAHLEALEAQKARLSLLVDNVRQTIKAEEGNMEMSDKEKFKGFLQNLVDENEQKYGQEAREKYGDKAVDESNRKMLNLSKERYDEMQALAAGINAMLEKAVREGLSPESEAGLEAALAHKRWLAFTWPQYTVQAHRGLAQMYLDDERFTKYYDGNMPGCAAFLKAAVDAHAEALGAEG